MKRMVQPYAKPLEVFLGPFVLDTVSRNLCVCTECTFLFPFFVPNFLPSMNCCCRTHNSMLSQEEWVQMPAEVREKTRIEKKVFPCSCAGFTRSGGSSSSFCLSCLVIIVEEEQRRRAARECAEKRIYCDVMAHVIYVIVGSPRAPLDLWKCIHGKKRIRSFQDLF